MTKPAFDKEDLRELVADVLDVELADVGDETRFVDDLDVDSLTALELIVRLERTYGIRLEESDVRQVTCLDQTYDLMTSKLTRAV
jgi:acyl carrier protein